MWLVESSKHKARDWNLCCYEIQLSLTKVTFDGWFRVEKVTLAAKPIEGTKLQKLVVYHNYGGVWAADASKCYEK